MWLPSYAQYTHVDSQLTVMPADRPLRPRLSAMSRGGVWASRRLHSYRRSTRVRWGGMARNYQKKRKLTTGPPPVFSSKPSPMTSSFALVTRISMNLSYTVSWTYTREPAVQSWPVLYRIPSAAQFAAGGADERTSQLRHPLELST